MTEQDRGKEKLNLGRKIVIFIGPEGSGKTIHSLRLAEESGKPYITTGDTIRYLAANDPGPLGNECREMFANHAYLAGETLLKILINRFNQVDAVDGFILDGGLRTLEETIGFSAILEAAGLQLPVNVMHLRIPGWMCFARLMGENGRKRSDDTTEGILSRLAKYYYHLGQRAKVIEKQDGWRLAHIDATREVEAVYEAVAENLATAAGTSQSA